MSERDKRQGSQGSGAEKGNEAERPGGYAPNHVIGVIDAGDDVERAVEMLSKCGFLDSEIHVVAGEAAADTLDGWSGRKGLITNMLIRTAELLGLQNDEMRLRERYETALRDGQFVVLVAAPSDTRKDLAARILREHGAHELNFLGRFAIERLVPSRGG